MAKVEESRCAALPAGRETRAHWYVNGCTAAVPQPGGSTKPAFTATMVPTNAPVQAPPARDAVSVAPPGSVKAGVSSGAPFQARFEVPQGATFKLRTALVELSPCESRTTSATWYAPATSGVKCGVAAVGSSRTAALFPGLLNVHADCSAGLAVGGGGEQRPGPRWVGAGGEGG